MRVTRTARLIALAGLVAGSAAAQPGQAPSIEGKWLTDDGKAVVVIDRCGADMCGEIARVLDKGRNVPTSDVANPDQRLRNRPIVGLKVLSGFRAEGASGRGGKA
jgi:uncharacterized protein (DUF2147 family)